MEEAIGTSTLSLLAIPLAFIVGFALRRGSVCMVEGTRQAVILGRTLRLRAFVVAAGAAGCVVLPLSWAFPTQGMLASGFPITLATLVGGALFGLGARINGGCQFGTLGRLASGELDFLITCVAAVGGATLALRTTMLSGPAESLLMRPTVPGGIVLALFVVLAAPALRPRYWRNFIRALHRREVQLSPIPAMLVVGMVGGVLYTLAGSWTVGSLLNREGAWLLGDAANHADGKAIAGAFALLAGALYAAVWTRKFHLSPPTMRVLTANAPGGFLMGAGAALVPGGNGTLLLYSMPSASPNGWVAFAAMTAVIALTFLPHRSGRRAPR
ncbi:YeeE/YedE thiosulfate transporter family protein [Qipengyuania soli]|uniref:YeeE/YedE family protein n=1 Tax=Qipengyuania soli TaxID=2782568 RepID=A0A7S8F4B1_9SPHN|nr:YeeE/YedE thiosulfate transporter family protein [Qipengyuania soli]QPC98845.1 YeeE/YedE family protein [Qipengyuania soli]